MATEEPCDQVHANECEHEENNQKNVLGLTKKQRKRELKSIGYELRDVPEGATDEDKLIALHRKFQLLTAENSDITSKLKQADKRIMLVSAERDQFHDSYNRVAVQKEKLEALCRELQKQNHQIRDQSMAMAQSEDEKRKEVADRFQSGIQEIQTQLNDYLQKNNKLREENQMLAEKLQKFIADHEKREEYTQKVMKTRELEAKLAEAKLTQAKVHHEQELMKEKRATAQALEECELMKQRFDAHKMIEFYKAKYQSFNKSMAKSNDLIENAKKEMEKMAKHVRSAESAALDWRSKWELSQKALLEMIDECRKEKEKSQALQKQVDKLSNLCRALRAAKDSSTAPRKEDENNSDAVTEAKAEAENQKENGGS
ncbi:unnamed protein product [Mesocestoides corti]|uniref:Alpha-taxilin n=1 Tax=Mesocestoides corti TaxID=53468 RepID=A0A0R3UND5_MESCO|nr:unnamed protein product [Mesocestoides corti]